MNARQIVAAKIYPQKYSASDKAVFLMQDGRKLANLFEKSALLKRDARAIAKADLLRETYRARNIYHATDLINYQTGELFDGYGVLINAINSRASKAYLMASGRRARKRVKEKVAETKLFVGERYRFLTLTMPPLRANVETVLAIKDRATTLFRKREPWTSNVRAAFIAEEMNIGDSSTILFTHYHAHAHALIVSKFIYQWQIADVWTNCVEKACAEFGVEFLMRNMVGNRLTVDVQDVAKYAKKNGRTLDESIDELCKYVVKGSDYDKVPVSEICEIESALFNRKMIKSYGDFNNQKGSRKSGNVSEDTSLDTKHTTDGARPFKRRVRRQSLIETGVRMITSGRREAWLQLLGVEMANRRAFRVEQLAWKHPHSTFCTLDGRQWFGNSTRPPKSNVVVLSNYQSKRTPSSANSPYPRI